MSTKKRRDGVLIKDNDPFHSIVPYIMPNRTEAEVSLTKEFDVTELNKYMAKENQKEDTQLKLFHAICTAISKTVYHRPKLNIFVAGRKFYQRKDITLSFVCKQKFADTAEETLMFMKVKPEMTLSDVSHTILGDTKKARTNKGNDLDKLMGFVGSLPRFVLEILFFILRRLEYHGCMPKDLSNGDPNYSSVLISNLGSIRSNSCYHHLSNYGTCSIMITIGRMHTVKDEDENGNPVTKEVVDMTFTLDERIADGFYFAKSLRYVDYALQHPDFLATPVETPFPEGLLD